MSASESAAKEKPRVQVQGHRGARARFPENTLPAFEHAIAVGADVLELDVVATQDDHLVVLHDLMATPERCLDQGKKRLAEPLAIRKNTLARVKKLDCGSLENPRFPRQKLVPGTPIPTLEEVLDLVLSNKRRIELNIETKTVPGHPDLSPTPERFAELVTGVLKKYRVVDRTVLQSFDHRVLLRAKERLPKLRTSVLIAESRPDVVAVARAAKADIISPNQWWIDRADVAAAHKAGLRVVPWTANGPNEWRRLLEMEVDGIITDDPEALLQFLENQHRAPRR